MRILVLPSIFSTACTSRGFVPAISKPWPIRTSVVSRYSFVLCWLAAGEEFIAAILGNRRSRWILRLVKDHITYRIPTVNQHQFSYRCCEYGIPFPCTSKLRISFSDSFCARFILDTLSLFRNKEGKFDWRTSFPSFNLVFEHSTSTDLRYSTLG